MKKNLLISFLVLGSLTACDQAEQATESKETAATESNSAVSRLSAAGSETATAVSEQLNAVVDSSATQVNQAVSNVAKGVADTAQAVSDSTEQALDRAKTEVSNATENTLTAAKQGVVDSVESVNAKAEALTDTLVKKTEEVAAGINEEASAAESATQEAIDSLITK